MVSYKCQKDSIIKKLQKRAATSATTLFASRRDNLFQYICYVFFLFQRFQIFHDLFLPLFRQIYNVLCFCFQKSLGHFSIIQCTGCCQEQLPGELWLCLRTIASGAIIRSVAPSLRSTSLALRSILSIMFLFWNLSTAISENSFCSLAVI